MKDKSSGKARGFGFVTFAKEESVDDVIKDYSVHYLRGKWIECKRAVAKEKLENSGIILNQSVQSSPGQRKLSSNNEEYTEELCKSLIDFILDDD